VTEAVRARQTPGTASRQNQDAERPAGEARLADAFLEANLEQLGLAPLTREAVKNATPSAELYRAERGELALRRAGRILGQAPEDAEIRRYCDEDEDSTLFLVFGAGFGHTARALRASTRSPIAIFEPDPGILRTVLELGPTDLSPHEIFCTTHDLTQAWIQLFGTRRSVVFVPTPGYLDAFPDEAAHLRQTLAQLVQRSRVNDATHRLRAREWISDLLSNVELLGEHPGFLALAGKYQGVPAFIVGAGPSLGKNGQHLLQAQKKGIVFAVNSSARALAKLGVEPHVLACMESIDVSHLLSGLDLIDHVIRAFSLTAHPNTLRTGKGPLLPVYEGLPQISAPLAALTGHHGLIVSGSVSTLAFSLAHRLGCSPIVFVGQDLAYTDGRAYAPGTPYEESRVEVSGDGKELRLNWSETLKSTHNVGGRKMHESEPMNETLAWGGEGKVLTGISFSAVRAWLEAAAIVLDRDAPGTRLVNATEGGARIEGFEETTLESLLAELPERNITVGRILRDAQATGHIPFERIASWAENQAELVGEAVRGARRLRRLSEAAEGSTRLGDLDVTKKLAKLERAERELTAAVARAALLDAWSWPVVDELMDEHPDTPDADPRKSAQNALAFEARLGRTIENSARELRNELLSLSSRLKGRTADAAR